MIFDKEYWERFCKGFTIYDCAFGFGNRYAFLMYEQTNSPHRDPLPETRFLFARMERPIERRFYRVQFNHFNFARIAYTEGQTQEYIAVDIGGNVYSYDKDRDGEEPKHPWQLKGSDLAGIITKVVRIGESVYTVGGPRRMHKRLGIGQWQDMTANLPIPTDFIQEKSGASLSYIWRDASGFSESDIYVTGGLGDVFHFNGKQFNKLSFPSNELLHNVCCAGDGNVYIGGNMGSLYVGRENKWKKLADGTSSVPFKDIAWFAGKLWCGSDYGLWELKDGKLIRAEIPAEVQLVSGAIDISPDGKLMLTAGPSGAALFDGTKWEVLFSSYELE